MSINDNWMLHKNNVLVKSFNIFKVFINKHTATCGPFCYNIPRSIACFIHPWNWYASSYPGYEIATVFHVVYFTFSGFGLSFFELQIIAIAFNTTCLGDILIFKMRKADGNKDSLRQELMGIIQLYTADYVNLVKTFSQSYQTLITCKYLTAVMNISFALFVIQLVSFILGGLYGYLYTNHLFPERLVCWVLNCFWNRLWNIPVWHHWNDDYA